MMDIKLINERIKNLREQRGWSEYRLAKEAGFEQSTLKVIKKEKHMPSLYTIEKICFAFGITISDFFDDEVFGHSKNKPLFISLWMKLSPLDKEKVLIYMFGLTRKELPKDFENELQ